MSYVIPQDFVSQMIAVGEKKLFMSARDTLIRSFMGAALLTMGAALAVTISTNTGNPLLGAVFFPIGFILLYLMGYDLLTGVFTMLPFAVLARRPGATWRGMLRVWGLVFCGNFAGAITVAVLIGITLTYGFST
ncbi:MAG: formate/nitrite transporter family protein, partial [Actinomycetes bacterium]